MAAQNEKMIKRLTEYLSGRPIAPILKESKEKGDLKALKVMCVVDYYMQKCNLYDRMKQQPKLLCQLMGFHSYGSFKFYDCHVVSEISSHVLQCKFCELAGPYHLMMTHMAINHNAHISHTCCAFCNRVDVAEHIQYGTLNECYRQYMERYGISPDDAPRFIVRKFYEQLRNIARAVDVLITRHDSFTGTGYRTIEKVNCKISGFPNTCIVYKPKKSHKKVNDAKLEQYFNLVVSYMFGANGNILRQDASEVEEVGNEHNEVIVLSSDDEEDNTNDTAFKIPLPVSSWKKSVLFVLSTKNYDLQMSR